MPRRREGSAASWNFSSALRISIPCLALFLAVSRVDSQPAPHPVLTYTGPPPAQNPQSACLRGISTIGTFAVGGETSPGTFYYTLLNPCPDCSSGLAPRNARFYMYFDQPCVLRVRLSIVGARPGPSCAIPDTSDVLVPFFDTILSGSPGGSFGPQLYVALFPPGMCIPPGPSYLVVQMLGRSCDVDPIYLWAANSFGCTTPCLQYVHGGGICDGICDECDANGTGYQFDMAVTMDCCSAVPTRPSSWGTLKVRYR